MLRGVATLGVGVEGTAESARREPVTTADAEPGLSHEPALDGLRGVAVAAVVAFHLGHLQGGFLGVDLFFVLSGFLITSLLLSEARRRGSVDLRRFWARRARRLLPALLVMLVGVAVLLLAFTPDGDRPRFRGDALATLGYVANWERLAGDLTYWDIFTQPSPLDHTWSLAIEEQFYLLWPLVALAAWRWRPQWRAPQRARLLAATAVGAAVTSLALLGLTYSPVDTSRAYFGTDTRIGATLGGAALATVVAGRARRQGRPSAALDLAAAVALVVIGWSLATVDGQDGWYYRGGLGVLILAALVAIGATTGGPPGHVARVLSWRPLCLLGIVSYGVYLWHWPVIVYATEERLGVGGWRLDAIRILVTLGVATVSYRVVELPIRRGTWRPSRVRWAWPATAGAIGVALVTLLAATQGTVRTPAGSDRAEALGTGERASDIYPARIPTAATRLLLVGDSGPVFLGPELVQEAAKTGDFTVAMSTSMFCSPLYAGDQVRFPDKVVKVRPCSPERRQRWADVVQHFDPEVVVYYLANAGGLGRVRIDGAWVMDCDPAFDAYIAETLLADVEILAAKGAMVVLATSPYVDVPTDDSDAQVDCRNETLGEIAARRPGVQVLDLNRFVANLQHATGEPTTRDLVHLNEPTARRVASWMLPEVAALVGRPAVGQPGGAKNSSAMLSGSRNASPDP
jgi:peptidoglycan/LPS O-acetylase OafA/YrhL